MASEMKKNTSATKEHSIILENRTRMTITGVLDVVSFSDNKVELKINMNSLVIKGKNFNMNQLDTDTGELSLTGEVAFIEYTKEKGSLFSGLFS